MKRRGMATASVVRPIIALVMFFAGVLALPEALSPSMLPLSLIAAVGFLLLAGVLAGEVGAAMGLPHLSGYMLAGVAAGPHGLGVLGETTVHDLAPVNTLALALIALAGGAELRLDLLRSRMASLVHAHAAQTLLGMIGMTAVFVALHPWIPFASGREAAALLGMGLLWAVVAISRSPSATLAILSETRARGPLAMHTLAFVMSSDVIVVVLVAITIAGARPLVDPTEVFSTADLALVGHEILGGLSIGTTVGLLLAVYLKLVGRQMVLLLLAVGFGVAEMLQYLHFDPLLAFLTAGFVVQNLTGRGPQLLHDIEQTTRVVFVLFFATAGAHLDLHLLARLWPVALALAASRGVITWVGARVGSRMARDEPSVRRWGFSGLLSQAGLSLGIAVLVARFFPEFGAGFHALAVATIAINELLGPLLFKVALERVGEARDPAATGPDASNLVSLGTSGGPDHVNPTPH